MLILLEFMTTIVPQLGSYLNAEMASQAGKVKKLVDVVVVIRGIIPVADVGRPKVFWKTLPALGISIEFEIES
jgi:hypothetical protein